MREAPALLTTFILGVAAGTAFAAFQAIRARRRGDNARPSREE